MEKQFCGEGMRRQVNIPFVDFSFHYVLILGTLVVSVNVHESKLRM